MPTTTDDGSVRFKVWGEKLVIVVPKDRADKAREVARLIAREPFQARTWRELGYFMIGVPLAGIALGFVLITMAAGFVLAITFVGLSVLALSIRGARGFAGLQRSLARQMIDERIEEPDAFVPRPGFFGWLQSALRDRTGWRSMAYFALKVPLVGFGVYFAWSVWWDAFACFIHILFIRGGSTPAEFGFVRNAFNPGFIHLSDNSFINFVGILITGFILFFAAPWALRLFIYFDRLLMRVFLAPDSIALRVRSLEEARAQTVDASAATLRRIERDLHDGTQAQLVALAMRLGLAKEKLEEGDNVDLEQVRDLIDGAHRGAKEAIVELRDLARGIHPPALDVGLEGALATLAARSTVPTECTVTLHDRPTPAIESIAYFCVAELLANVAQHAHASRATITATQSGRWLRLVVRDDGLGGAELSSQGTASSGLAGLSDRVRTVDGRFHLTSPMGGPTVVTVDLPLHA